MAREWYYTGTVWNLANVTTNSAATFDQANTAFARANSNMPTNGYANTSNNWFQGPLNVSGNIRIAGLTTTTDTVKVVGGIGQTGNMICLQDSGGNTLFRMLPNGKIYGAISPGSTNGEIEMEICQYFMMRGSTSKQTMTTANATTNQVFVYGRRGRLFHVEAFLSVDTPRGAAGVANGVIFGLDLEAGQFQQGGQFFNPTSATAIKEWTTSANGAGPLMISDPTVGTTVPMGNTPILCHYTGVYENAANVDTSPGAQFVFNFGTALTSLDFNSPNSAVLVMVVQ